MISRNTFKATEKYASNGMGDGAESGSGLVSTRKKIIRQIVLKVQTISGTNRVSKGTHNC